MQFSFISATLLAIASLATAQTAGFDAITSPAEGTVAAAGSPLEIVWQPGDVTGPITITLLQGATPSTLQLGDVIAASIDNSLGKFTYNIPATAGSFATYGFQITLDAAPTTLQYSFPFSITGGASSAATSSTGSSSSATSTTTIRLTQATSTSTTEVTSTSANTTSTAVVSSTISSTTAVVTSVASSNSSSNISTTLSKGTATRTSTSGSGSSATSSSVATATANAAANIATGGLAMIGGLFIAFAL
ncbi:hypothetical protein PVAG01_05465 [Phlyctema vagabunda]|uniref:Yeast cell wall synthesis Kre9/Knh1-like N-terminal domain-containing protein n=1 Tax=Phlyctema vagabunda TaxID=108571 RepID=A0ABR4PK72_9HELO